MEAFVIHTHHNYMTVYKHHNMYIKSRNLRNYNYPCLQKEPSSGTHMCWSYTTLCHHLCDATLRLRIAAMTTQVSKSASQERSRHTPPHACRKRESDTVNRETRQASKDTLHKKLDLKKVGHRQQF